jgi:hypothetical protein
MMAGQQPTKKRRRITPTKATTQRRGHAPDPQFVHLLQLPAEVRLMIYDFVMWDECVKAYGERR